MGCVLCSWFVCALMFGWVGCVFGFVGGCICFGWFVSVLDLQFRDFGSWCLLDVGCCGWAWMGL